MNDTVKIEKIEDFLEHLQIEERSEGTIQKYRRDLNAFFGWIGDKAVTKEAASGWKEYLLSRHYKPVTINSMLSALNSFFCFCGRYEYRVKFLRIQRRIFRSQERELTRREYERLLTTAQNAGKTRLALVMETICATGIRVSEVSYITLEAVENGRAEIALKGKIRTILLPGKLCRKLRKYAKQQKITSGGIFLTKSGNLLSRKQIWAEMKSLCSQAGIVPSKVFPHNLRHLFARIFYQSARDVVKLADVLGHSNIETTRIYLISTGEEHARQIERLGLVS